ncbi:MAG: hypothetical protein H6Q72_2834 [Firmicutes bacterium]|nr:hypothetical protein [Bacillota bacterium]
MLQVKNQAEELQHLIFSYQPAKFEKKLVEFIDLLGTKSCLQAKEPVFSKTLQALLTALQQKDYLLFADLLEYKLQPLLSDVKEEGTV